MEELPKEYAGRCIATVDEHVVASGKNYLETYQKAKKLFPNRLISLAYVPTKKEALTFL